MSHNNAAFEGKKSLQENGFTVLKEFLPPSVVRDIESDVLSHSWANPLDINTNIISSDDASCLSSAHNCSEFSASYRELIKSNLITDKFSYLLDAQPRGDWQNNSSYFFKNRQSRDIRPHQDNAYFNLVDGSQCLTFYCPVNEQCRLNGGIYYFLGTGKINSLPHVPEGNLGASMCLNAQALKSLSKLKVFYPDLKVGDVVVHNANVVHGTLPNGRGKRCEAFNFTIVAKGNYTDEKKLMNYREKLRVFLASKKTVR